MTFDELFKLDPYSLTQSQKEEIYKEYLKDLTLHHMANCKEYANILKSITFDVNSIDSYHAIPALPVRLFKELSLKSCCDEDIVKTMTSSGTSGQKVSKIFLDRDTATHQQQVMAKIVANYIGAARVPMIIIDCPSVIKNRNMFSARGAGILGFSLFGSKKIYALDDDMNLQVDAIKEFLEIHKGKTIFLFGFTFMIWQHFYKALKSLKEKGITLNLENGVMIHGGGWKKLISEAVSPLEFNQRLQDVCGIKRVHNYYGMVEQTGCIYMQCECGHLHASIFSDVNTRRAKDFSLCNVGETGIVEVTSVLPESYPGHIILTEDEGTILGIDDCPCGRKGKYFEIKGRLKDAEIRGCSDTYATKF